MSDSDDTDVLLLIPPDLFLVPSSSDSDVSSDRANSGYGRGKTGVISELVEHMQLLESRIYHIEAKDSSLDATLLNNSLDSKIQCTTLARSRQTLPRTRFSTSQSCASLQNTPVKPRQSLSVPSTPKGNSLSNGTNGQWDDMRSGYRPSMVAKVNATNANSGDQSKHDCLTPYSDSSAMPFTSCSMGFPHAVTVASKGEPSASRSTDYCRNSNNMYIKPCNQLHSVSSAPSLPSTIGSHHFHSNFVQDMELSEVDELLQEMEATELELSKRINSVSTYQYLKDQSSLLSNQPSNNVKVEEVEAVPRNSINRKLDFQSYDLRSQYCDLSAICKKKSTDTFPDISLPYDESVQGDETHKMISEFKSWGQSLQQPISKTEEQKVEEPAIINNKNNLPSNSGMMTSDIKAKEAANGESIRNADATSAENKHIVNNVQIQPTQKSLDTTQLPSESSKNNVVLPPKYVERNILHSSEICKNSQNVRETCDLPFARCTAYASANTEFLPRKSQRLLSLSDFWDNNSTKSQEELFRIKLEEEKFRREHCEHLIQELQKRLLEQQEKVAVALRVDNEKNELIAQFHSAWNKLKQRVHVLEADHESLETNIRNVTEKHQLEVAEFQSQIKRCEGELSKALDLAAGYKEKSDTVIKEKVDLLKSHADELEGYKSLVQEAEKRYEKVRTEYNKLSEKNQQTEEALKNLQQELGKERLRSGEVRNEMNVIHKALDTCEAELIILRQEKENLQLKLKEEVNRNTILQQKNANLLSSINDAKMAEKLAKDETKSVVEEKEKIRAELQEVYQTQVDEVVKAKLQEFQMQLDAAESEFLEELKTRQQVIAECAARKIKDIMDKHRLEINLLEEKHKEEKRLCELQLAQAAQKSSILETQLNSQRATKSHLAEQLHSVMQKQWQQALQIISGGNMENLTPLQRIHAEKFFECKGPRKSESMPNCYAKLTQEPLRVKSQLSEAKNFHGGRDDQNETISTITPIDDTPVTSRKESKDDLRKYIRMIAELQQAREEFPQGRESVPSPPLLCREVPRKHYTKKELSIMSEDSVTWQPASEVSTHDVSEFIPISQKFTTKTEQQKSKPPWK